MQPRAGRTQRVTRLRLNERSSVRPEPSVSYNNAMAENLFTVAALRNTAEADLIRGKLEAAGITAVLVEPPPPAAGAPPGRVQVQVSQPDFERAMQLLFPIPQIAPARKPALPMMPGWQCPKCGEQVMGPFPACWSCGTPREGSAQPESSGASPLAGPPRMPPTPPPPGELTPPPMQPRMTMPGAAAIPPMTVPNIPPAPQPVGETAARRPAMNGDHATKAAPLLPVRRPRSAEDDSLTITVPAWDPATGKSAGGRAGGSKRSPTDYDDRAARRAWWTAVGGLIFPPVLIYSMFVIVVLGLTNRPLSPRGERYFYGALALNALLLAAFFAFYSTQK
jgi:hypothetical protein